MTGLRGRMNIQRQKLPSLWIPWALMLHREGRSLQRITMTSCRVPCRPECASISTLVRIPAKDGRRWLKQASIVQTGETPCQETRLRVLLPRARPRLLHAISHLLHAITWQMLPLHAPESASQVAAAVAHLSCFTNT